MPYARNKDGDRIYYEVHGHEGPHVVLLMGIGLSSRFWLNIPKSLSAQMGRPHRVITIDNRGTGRSERPLVPWTMADMADDVKRVLDAVGVERAVLAGLSMGGMIAQHVALRHPTRVAGLILLATWSGLPFGELPSPRALETLARGFMNGMRGRELALLMYPEHMLETALRRFREEGFAHVVKAETIHLRTFFYHLFAAGTHSTWHALHRVRCPTVILAGNDDRLIPPGNSRRMAKRIRHAKLELLPDLGHDMILLAPDCVARGLRMLEAPATCAVSGSAPTAH